MRPAALRWRPTRSGWCSSPRTSCPRLTPPRSSRTTTASTRRPPCRRRRRRSTRRTRTRADLADHDGQGRLMTSMHLDEQPTPARSVPIVAVDPDPARRAALVAAIAPDPVRELYAIEDLEDQLAPTEAAIVLLGPSMADTIGLSSVERLARLYPQTASILVVENLTTEVLQRALRAGVKDVLTAPVEPAHLHQSVDRILAALVPTAPKLDAANVPHEGGRVVTVFSTKGGAGKSVIAANLAVVL